MTGPPLSVGLWAAAFAPVCLLFVLILRGRLSSQRAASAVLALALIIAAWIFQAGPTAIAVALGKGAWLGVWILCVVWPALLLYRVASVGGLDRLGALFTSILPRRRENLLIVAWVFPAFIQGVAGFGTPIAVAAPLLVAMGWGRVRAVVYPLIGYHWAVTFGSMGSSFYMASLTAGFGPSDQAGLAAPAALLLGVNCLAAGALVLALDGGWAALREGLRTLLCVGLPMAATLLGVAVVVPAVATLSSAGVGFLAVALLAFSDRRVARRRARAGAIVGRADGGQAGEDTGALWRLLVLSPYAYLLVTTLPVFLVPASRQWVRGHLLVAPSFPQTVTGFGWRNPAEFGYTPVALLGHPGFYVLLACLLGWLTYRLGGLWRGPESVGVLSHWARSLPSASISIIVLACLATLMVDSGMVSVLADGAAVAAGPAYPALAPMVGALGSFMTGSTTSSNALLAALQADVARLLDVSPALLVAAQTAGGNVGNSVAPVVALIGAGAVGDVGLLSRILRACMAPAAMLLALLSVMTVLAVTLG